MNSKLFPLRIGYTLKKITATAFRRKPSCRSKLGIRFGLFLCNDSNIKICNESFLHFIDTKVNATCYDLITGVLHF